MTPVSSEVEGLHQSAHVLSELQEALYSPTGTQETLDNQFDDNQFHLASENPGNVTRVHNT